MKKKIFILMAITGLFMSSCSNNGNKAETGDAEDVTIEKTDETVTYNKIKDGSYMEWRASHLGGVSRRFGKVFFKDATLLVNNGNLTNAEVIVDMNSLTVENFEEGSEDKENLTGHLKGEDFFNVEKYPTSKFELTGVEKTEGDFNSLVTGNLTILDVTKSITFKANISINENEVSVISEDFSIDRTEWGLTYHVEGSEGVPVDYLIANDIGFTINLTVTK